MIKWIVELLFPKTRSVVVFRGIPASKYSDLVYAFSIILDEELEVAQVLSELLTVLPSSGVSDDVQVLIESERVYNSFILFLSRNNINFTSE